MQRIINDIPYAIETSGAGERQALLLHYFGGSGASWHEVMSRVPGIACFAPSLAGFGATPAPNVDYTVDQYAADIRTMIDTLELTDFALVGHSMGGKIALALAALQPAGLRELILVAPSPPTLEPMTEADRKRLLAAHGDSGAIAAQIEQIVGVGLAENLRAQAVAENINVAASAWRWWLEAGSREDISAQLAAINVPVTMLVGERDPVIAPGLITAQMTPYLPGTTSKITVLPDVGHLLPYEAPQAIADALTDERR